ncbi:hypothetical protein [Prochlorococcus sp. MIT 1307]|uniref:hypothetical protein n=1 Tax=Prochlorococcus sp. MIT 1307 TaxID=3096219 RepID=UPI002A7532B3|nr:hypothetical protein [Prochlorococcus sp. MIT 1307]
MDKQNHWVLLEHTCAPDDPLGVHFDLLLEDKGFCRSWRLLTFPALGLPAQKVVALPPHRLAWLEIQEADLTKGRGKVRRLIGGIYLGELPDDDIHPIRIRLHSNEIVGTLEIKNSLCQLFSLSESDFD